MARLALLASLLCAATASAAPVARPYNALKAVGRSDLLLDQHKPDEAIRELDPHNARAFRLRAYVRAHSGDLKGAIFDCDKAIQLDPNMDSPFRLRGVAYARLGDFDNALKNLNEAVRLDLTEASNLAARGGVLLRKGNLVKAEADLTEAIRLDPTCSDAFLNRGAIRAKEGEWERALKDLDEALRLDPKNAIALYNRALLHGACPVAKYRDGEKAIVDARARCELKGWTDSESLAVLAVAYAEAGDFDAAVKWQKKAMEDIAFATSDSNPQEVLRMYQQKQPFRGNPTK